MLSAFIKDWNAGSIYVYPLERAVLLCGGEMTSIGDRPPKSMRDAFYKITDKPYLDSAELIRAEDVDVRVVQEAGYADLLEFEIELAQICDVVLLFCESIGSVAEFSSFVMVEDINRKLLVVMRNDHYHTNSFIKFGPVKRLINIDRQAVYLVDDSDLNITAKSIRNIDLDTLSERLRQPIRRALERGRERETFQKDRVGHATKLATGLIQEFGALTTEEIKILLEKAGVLRSIEAITGYMLCAMTAGWVYERRKGATDLFFAKAGRPASALKFEHGSPLIDSVRRRYLIREFWKANDVDRYRGIIENEGATV
jgi:hypothetical protein